MQESWLSPLCVYESVYPPQLSQGPPQAHHVLIYFLASLPPGKGSSPLKLSEGEVESAVWLSHQNVVGGLNDNPKTAQNEFVAFGCDGKPLEHVQLAELQPQMQADGNYSNEVLSTGIS